MNNDTNQNFSGLDDLNIAVAIYEPYISNIHTYENKLIYKNNCVQNNMLLDAGEYYWENNETYEKLNLNELLFQCVTNVIGENKFQKFIKHVADSNEYFMLLVSKFQDKWLQFTIYKDANNLLNVKKQKLYEEALNNAKDSIFIFNEFGKILYANMEALKEYGYSYDELRDMYTYNLRYKIDSEIVNKQFGMAKNGGIEFETVHKRKDGSSFIVEVKSVGVVIDNDKNVLSIVRNITNRRKLDEEMKTLALIVESSDDAIISKSLDGIIRSWNKGAEVIYGYTKDEVIGKHISIISADSVGDDINEILKKVHDGIKVEHYETTRKKKNGELIMVSLTVSPIYDTNNNIVGISTIGRDVTETRKLTDRMNQSEKKYRTLFSNMNQGVALHEIILDKNNTPIDYRFLEMNDSFAKILDVKSEDYIGKTVLEVLPNTEKYWIEQYGKVALTGNQLKYENYAKDFNKYFEAYAFSPAQGQFAVIITDITERKLSEIEKTQMDGPTGVYNKRYINEMLPAELKNCYESDYPLSLILADIDHFKEVNDIYGHQAGDKILKDFAEILKNSVRKDLDWVGRYGGDEFLIVLNNAELETAYSIAEKIRKTVSKKVFVYDDNKIETTSSFGVCSTKDKKYDTKSILEEVDKNLYEAKKNGRNMTETDNEVKTSDVQQLILNRKIQELKDNLDEIYMLMEKKTEDVSKTKVVDTSKTKLNKCFDELMSEYLKN